MVLPVLPLDPKAADGRHQVLPSGTFSTRRFFAFRNQLLECLRPFGTVGPMGDTPLDELALQDGPHSGRVECNEPAYYVLDDQWFDQQMFVRVEIAPEHLSRDVIESLTDLLVHHPGWAVGFSVSRRTGPPTESHGLGYVLVFQDRLMVDGPAFSECLTSEDVAIRCCSLAAA